MEDRDDLEGIEPRGAERRSGVTPVLDANRASPADSPGVHWSAVREQVPTMLEILAVRQARLGVFMGK